ncbi:MAG: PilT/PilU family type 4a pilus ATPase, partial [Actinomycetota bacterium]|nr:PilT/PilU family type 4a pilus ATPase [Actinomycetota bacterium]
MAQTSSRQLGELLLDRKVISRDVLELVLDREEREGVPMTALLVKEGLVGEKDILAAVAEQVHLPFVDLAVYPVRPDLDGLVPEDTAREYNAVAIDRQQDRLVVAMENPSDPDAVRAVEEALGESITAAIGVRSELVEQVQRMYGRVDGEGASDRSNIHLNDLLDRILDLGGSDLHLTVGVPPSVRVNGGIKHMTEFPVMTASDIRRMLYDVLTQKQRDRFEGELELDTSHTIPGRGRFRMNIYQQRNAMGAVFRAIPTEIIPIQDLGLPPVVETFAEMHRGLVLVTGPTGSGKSTSLAAVIDIVNRNRNDHIMTVEDPIEFVHQHKQCVVNQREVGEDTHSFANALKSVLRQDPDVVLVGEMRDLETIATAISAAETGHLVFGT